MNRTGLDRSSKAVQHCAIRPGLITVFCRNQAILFQAYPLIGVL